ncbi:hypothetical protein GCM10022205_49180 [Spinactinospora alkalitolerans]
MGVLAVVGTAGVGPRHKERTEPGGPVRGPAVPAACAGRPPGAAAARTAVRAATLVRPRGPHIRPGNGQRAGTAGPRTGPGVRGARHAVKWGIHET